MTKSEAASPRDEILRRALALDTSDRAFLVNALEESLTQSGFASDDIAAAWAGEIDRRIAGYDRGETTTVNFEQVNEHIRQAVAEQRARQATQ